MPIADAAEPERKVTRSHLLRYSSLKDFKFDVPDGWDDRNIAIFLESCFANLEALRKYTVTGDEATWKEVARSGLEKSGSIKCFTVNCCLELSNCLKNYVAKKGKEMMDNVIFKQLHAVVEELLPYWQTPRASTSASPSTPRSDPKPFEKLVEAATADQTTLLAVPPFTTSDETEKAVRVIASLMKEHYKDASSKVSFRNSIWKEVVSSIEKDFGVSVDPRQFLESYKTSIVRLVNQIDDVVEKEKSFLELVNGLLPYFDSIPPKSIKKMEFIISTEAALLDRMNKSLSSQKPSKKTEVVESGNLILTLYDSSPTSASDEVADHNSTIVSSETVDCFAVAGDDTKKSQPPEINHVQEDVSLELVVKDQSFAENEASAEPALEPTVAHVPEPEPAPKRRVRRKWLLSSDTPAKRTRRMAALAAEAENVATVVTNLEEKSNQIPPSDALAASSLEITFDPKIGAPPENLPSSTGAASDSDDADESCLLGTNILPHRSMVGNRSRGTGMLPRDNMNPIVVLDKSVAERYLEAALSPRLKRIPPKKLQSIPKRRASPISTMTSTPSAVSTSTALVPRRRGRPPKNRQPLPSTSGMSDANASSYIQVEPIPLARKTSSAMAIASPPTRMYDVSTHRQSSSLVPMAPSSGSSAVAHPSNVNSDQPPSWFVHYIEETRRREQWKMMQIVKLHDEVKESENNRKAILEMILAGVNENRSLGGIVGAAAAERPSDSSIGAANVTVPSRSQISVDVNPAKYL